MATQKLSYDRYPHPKPLKVYWQPGCSSCLMTKEFLLDNNVEFESINVLEDEAVSGTLKHWACAWSLWSPADGLGQWPRVPGCSEGRRLHLATARTLGLARSSPVSMPF
ncbi:MAG: hypothetical protein CM1200mP20_14410 [Pseudomonadota bacterium]|nr:MAG: hypothetical protein CM1200mP20_14410 [Pseudomonadota bacterium]